MRWCGVLESYR